MFATYDQTEVLIIGSAEEWIECARSIQNLLDETRVALGGDLAEMRLVVSKDGYPGLLNLSLIPPCLIIQSDSDGLGKLAASLLNVFGEVLESGAHSPIPPHIHLDEAWPDLVHHCNRSVVLQLSRS